MRLGGLPQWLSGKEFACNAGALGNAGLIPGSGRSPGGGRGNPLHYSCLENPMDRGHHGLQSIGSRRVRHDWRDLAQHTRICIVYDLKVFLVNEERRIMQLIWDWGIVIASRKEEKEKGPDLVRSETWGIVHLGGSEGVYWSHGYWGTNEMELEI